MYHLVKHELGSGCGIWLALAWRWHISGNETNSSCSRTYCGTNRSSLNIDHGWKIIFHRWSLLKSLLSAKLAASWCPWQALQGGFVLPAMLGHSGMDWAHLAWSTPTQVGWEVHQMLLQSEISVTAPQWRLALLPADTCEVCSRAVSCTFLLNSLTALKCQWHGHKSSYPY